MPLTIVKCVDVFVVSTSHDVDIEIVLSNELLCAFITKSCPSSMYHYLCIHK